MGKEAQSKSSRCCTIMIFIFVFLVGLSVLLFWVIVKPRRPIFTIDEGSIQGYNLTSNNHLNAAFSFAVRAYNPNTKASLSYEFLDIKAYHGGQIVGYVGVHSFLQPRENMTSLRLGAVAVDMPLFESPGEVDLNIELQGKLWFKVGSFNLHRYKLKAKCYPVVVYFNSSRAFPRIDCYLKLK